MDANEIEKIFEKVIDRFFNEKEFARPWFPDKISTDEIKQIIINEDPQTKMIIKMGQTPEWFFERLYNYKLYEYMLKLPPTEAV